MTTDSTWDRTRWRDAQQGEYFRSMQAPSRPASTTISNSPQGAVLDSYPQPWNETLRDDVDKQNHKLPSLTQPYAYASNYHSRLQDHHSPSAGGKYDSQRLAESTEKAASWQSLRYDPDDRGNERQTSDVPLTLHIPKSQDLLRTSPGSAAIPHEKYPTNMYGSRSNQTTSLPSFASLDEQAGRVNDSDEVESAALSARSSCYFCAKIQPMVKEVAIVVVELDESVQTSCNKSITRTPDCPQDSPLRAVQWILERLKCAKSDLQAASRGSQLDYGYQQTTSSLSSMPSRNMSPANAFKRPAERWEYDEGPLPKRPRSGPSPTDVQAPVSALSTDHRRASIDFMTRDQLHHRGFSPPPTDSVPNSAYPRTCSPPQSGRPMRALPSPSSVAYPPSAAPSFLTQTAQSVESPNTSYQPAPSLHSVSTSSATSAHIADLQHQVTLKSLSLQTLQSEYASLLSKLQRLNVKTQAIERKSNVADEEVNHLTNKNEDLTQQLQSLQEQLEECEKRREQERDDASREKDQWLQMLEQQRQLQAKYQDDKRVLGQQIAALQAGKDRPHEGSSGQSGSHDSTLIEARSIGSTVEPLGEALTNVTALKAKIDGLRLALEEAREHNRVLDERAKEVLQRSTSLGSTIDRALDDSSSVTKTGKDLEGMDGNCSHDDSRQKSATSSTLSETEQMRPLGAPSKSYIPAEMIADFAGGISSGRKELGADVAHSNLTPEDVVKAHGPVPSLPSSIRLPTTRDKVASWTAGANESDSSSNRHQQRDHRGESFSSTPTFGLPLEVNDIGLFRPLQQQEPEKYSNSAWSQVQRERLPQSYYSSPDAILDDSSSGSSRLTNSESTEDSETATESLAEPDWVAARSVPISTSKSPGQYQGFRDFGRGLHRHRLASGDAEISSAMPPPPLPRPTF